MTPEALSDLIIEALEDRKGQRILALDVRRLTSITDFMVIVSGTSNRHVKALVDSVAEAATAAGARPLGIEGLETCEWVLVDLNDVIVHVMLPRVREFYGLESLWEVAPKARGTGKSRGAARGKSKPAAKSAARAARGAPKKKSSSRATGSPRAARARSPARRGSTSKTGPRAGR